VHCAPNLPKWDLIDKESQFPWCKTLLLTNFGGGAFTGVTSGRPEETEKDKA